MKRRFKIRIKPASVAAYVFMLLLVGFTALPLVYMISTAFKPLNELLAFPPIFFVRAPTLKNFSDLFIALSTTEVPFLRYVLNSVFVTAVTVVGVIFVSSLGAYGLAKHRPKGSGFIMTLIISALMFSPYVIQIPSYLIIGKLGMMDSYLALILPKVAVAFNFFLMERFMIEVPDTLIEAARIDGARELKIFWKIIMPLLRPAWATLIVFSFTTVWNDYLGPLIYITDPAEKTLPLALQLVSGGVGIANIARAGAFAAATFLITMPTIIIFVTMQSRVMKTMAHSGIKA